MTDPSTSVPTTAPSNPPRLELVRHPLRVRMLRVAAVTRPAPRLVRISLTGDELDGFCSAGPADHVKVFFPHAGETEPIVPQIGPDGIRPGEGPRPIARDYTPRHHRLDEGVLELDFVLHDGGHASAWAERAEVGAPLAVAGPRGSHVPTGDFGGLLLIGDETAVPAIDNWLRWAAPGLPVTALIEVQGEDDAVTFDTAADLDLRWVPRGDAGPGRSAALVAAAAEAPAPGPSTFCWLAGETSVVGAVRRHLVDDRRVDERLVHARGYWKLGAADHQEPHAD